MANRNAPNGFSPVKTKDGHNTAKIGLYYIPVTDGTAVGIGDFVKLTTGADLLGNPTVTRVTTPATDIVLGSIVGFAFDPTNLMNKYRLANTARYAYVSDDPEAVYEAQVQGGNLLVADIGYNFYYTVSGGVNTTTGVSAEGIDYTNKAVTASFPLQVIGLAQTQNNAFGQYARATVRLNNPQLGFATAGI